MRTLVAAETSGSLRNAFETVITETPAYWAMSLSRTIFRRQQAEGGGWKERRGKTQNATDEISIYSSFCIVPSSFGHRRRAIAVCGAEFPEMNCPPDASTERYDGCGESSPRRRRQVRQPPGRPHSKWSRVPGWLP